jgi:tyrosine-protein kinase Etk/Wzc
MARSYTMQQDITPPLTSDDKETDYFEYLEIIARRKKMILTATIATFAILLICSLFSPPVYQATARILPPQPDRGLMGLMMGQMGGNALSSFAGSLLGTGTSADQYASILESERIKDPIIDRFKLMKEYDQDYRVRMYKKMEKLVIIKTGKKEGIITITAMDEDPKKAADIANGYIEELDKLVAEMSMSEAGRNRRFLEERLVQARTDLARAEEAMKSFQSKNKVIDVPDQAKASIEGVALLKAQLANQEVQLASFRSYLTDSSREVTFLKASISDIKGQIARLEGINSGSAILSVGSIPALGEEQVRLLREFKIQEMLVELLTKQYEISKLTEAKNIDTVQVIQRARVPDLKDHPKFRKRYVLLLTILVFSVTVSWALFEDYRQKMPSEEVERWRRILSLIKD